MKDNLRDPVAVAQVDEEEASQVAILLYPAVEGDPFAAIGCGQFATGGGPLKFRKSGQR